MTSQQPPEGLSAENRALIERVLGDDSLYVSNKFLCDDLNALLNAARSTSPAPDHKAGEREQVADVVRALREASDERQRVAWTRMDGGQEWSLAAVLADQAADLIEQLSDQLAEARSEVEGLKGKAQSNFDDAKAYADTAKWQRERAEAAEAERDTLAAQLVGAREALDGLVNASPALIVKAIREPADAAGLEKWTAAITVARQALSMSILRGDKGCSLGAIEAPACGSPADSQPSGGAE